VLGLSAYSAAPFSALSGIAYNSAIDEVANVADSIFAQAVFGAILSEQAQGGDAASSLVAVYSAVLEQAQGSDTASSLADMYAAVVEAGSGVATNVARVTFLASIQEAVAADDTVSTIAIFNAALAESGIASDSIVGRFLWEIINTEQSPEWSAPLPFEYAGNVAAISGFAFSESPFAGQQWVYTPVNIEWTTVEADTQTVWNVIKTVN
jgi:hypothetical protein